MDYITQKAQELVAGIKNEIANQPDISVFSGNNALVELDRLNKRYGNGLTTGYDELDNMFTLLPQQLYLVSASTHTGKCFGKGTKVMMFNGKVKNIEDIKTGEYLMGDDSTPRRVLSLARGEDKMYKVEQTKGDDYIVNSKHILCLKSTNFKNKSHYKGKITSSRFIKNKEIEISVEDYLNKSKTFKHRYYGYANNVNFKNKKLEIEPYFLGLWLGDGDSSSVRITSNDFEIANYLKEYASKLNHKLKIHDVVGKCTTYSITSFCKNKNNLQSKLRKLNLLDNKHIPFKYLVNSRENRLQLLAGLIDTDGSYSTKNKHFEFSNKSKRLIDDFSFLARTLGFCCDVKETLKSCNGKQKELYYRCLVRGDCSIIPTNVKRKQAEKRIRKDDVLKHGIKVKYVGRGEYYGFVIDGNRKFLLGDCTVVHNTTFCLNICARIASLGEPVLFCSLEQGVFIADRVVNMVGSFPEKLSILTSNSMVGIKELTDYIFAMAEKPKLVCIDHLHFIKKKGNKVTQDIDDMMAEIQNMSKKLEIPVIVITHVRKLNEDKAPTLDDLRDSSSLSQIPSVVLLLHRPKNEGEALKSSILSPYGALIVAKNRIQGKTGAIKFEILDNGIIQFFQEPNFARKVNLNENKTVENKTTSNMTFEEVKNIFD